MMTDVDAAYEEELSLEELWAKLRQVLPLALLLAVVSGVIAYFMVGRQPPVFEATSRVIVVQPYNTAGFSSAVVNVPPLDPDAYREVALSLPVLRQAMGEGLDYQELKKKLRVRVVKGQRSSVLSLAVRHQDPKTAAAWANAWAQALKAWEDERAKGNFARDENSLRTRLEVVDKELADALKAGDESRVRALERLKADVLHDLDLVRAMRISATGNLQILESAAIPTRPVAPKPKLAAVLAAVLVLFLVVAVVFLREALDPRIRSSEEAARLVGLPVLGEFPKMPPGVSRELPKEASSFLRTNVDHALIGVSPKVILVSSPEASEGKSSVALSLAKAYARVERPTLLIDADLRKAVLDREFDVKGARGLIQYLDDPFAEVEPAQVGAFLDFIPAGGVAENPDELLTEHWKEFLSGVLSQGRYEVIVIDSAPLLPVADTLVLAPHASGTLLVAGEGVTYKRRLQSATELLQRIGVKIVGLAVTQVRSSWLFSLGKGKYGYGYGYGYGGYGKKERKKRGLGASSGD